MPRPDSGVILDDGSEESGSLGHRDSMRTIRSGAAGRGSQVPETVLEIITPTAGFDDMMQPSMLAMTGGTDVQAWNNGVVYPQMIADQMLPANGLTTQADYMNWGQMYPAFDTLGNGFTGFNGQH